MSGKPNPWKDQVALYFLSIGVISVDDKGILWRLKDRRGRHHALGSISPRKLGTLMSTGYIWAQIGFNGKQYKIYAHRIVWQALNGIIPEGLEINHKNGIRHDNRPENLELMTPSENQRHGFRVLGRIALRGETHNSAKLTENDVREMREYYKNNKISFTELGVKYGILRKQTYNIITRRSWTHI